MFSDIEPPYIAHTQDTEIESTENYIEYCKYAQKLQTELGEGSIFVSDEIDRINLALAGIEEKRLKLAGKEADLKRQMSYLQTINNLITKRKQDLNTEYGSAAKANNSGVGGVSKRTEVEDKQSDRRNDGQFF